MRRILVLAIVLFGANAAFAQQRHELSVEQAVEIAFRNVAELKNARLEYEIQKAKNAEILGQALPQITGSAGVQHYIELPKILFPDGSQAGVYSILKNEGLLPQSTPVPAPTMQQISFQQPWNANLSGTLTQLLFQPDVFVGLQARKTALNLTEAQIKTVEEKVKDSAYKKYYAILIAQKQLDFLNESILRVNKLFSDQQALFKNGFIEKLDLDKTEVQLNNLKTTRSLVENALQINYGVLKLTLNLPQKDTVFLTDNLTIDKVKEDVLIDTFNYDTRAEIQSLQYLRDLQKLDIKRYKMGYIPTLAAQFNYGVSGMGNHFITDKSTIWLRSSFVGLSLSVPIFDGLQRQQKILQSKLTLEKTENNLDALKNAIDFEQFAFKSQFTNALLNLDAMDRNMELAKKVFNATQIKYQQGLGSSFEVLQSETELQTAQNNYFNALYNAIVSKISYYRSLGRL